MKILIIGGCGFIGSHVCDALLRAGHSLRVFDRQPERYRAPLPRVEYVFGDFREKMELLEALAGMDAVLHLVSTTFPGTADLDPQSDVRDNLISTLDLLNGMVSHGIAKLLFLSSGGTVYGIPETVPIPEDHPLRPINSYGIVKTAIENYVEMFGRSRGLEPVIIRASNPYGPRQGHAGVQGVISTFMQRLKSGEAIEIWGDGSVVRDYVHVKDLAELCVTATESPRTGAYNCGSGAGVSLKDLVEALSMATGHQITPVYKSGRALDVPVSVLDCRAAERDFDWRPQVGLHEGLSETWEWVSGT